MAILIQKEAGVINIIDDTKAAGNQINSTLSVDSLAKPITRSPLPDEVHVFDDKGKLTYQFKLDGTLRYQDDGGASTLWVGDVDDLASKLNNEYFVTAGGGGGSTTTDIVYYIKFNQQIPFPDDVTNNVTFVYASENSESALFDDGGNLSNSYNDLDEFVTAFNLEQSLFEFYVLSDAQRVRISDPNTVLGVRGGTRAMPESWGNDIIIDWNTGAAAESNNLYTLYPNSSSQDQTTALIAEFKATNESQLEIIKANTATSPFIEIGLGNITGRSSVNKWGYNDDVDIASPEIIASFGGAFDPNVNIIKTAQTFTITYNVAADGLGKTGATSIGVSYLDENYNLQDAIHVLGNTGSDVTSFTGLGINRVYVLANGGLGWNANDITLTATNDATIQARVPALNSVTQQALFHTPINGTLLLTEIYLNALKSSGGGSPSVRFKAYSWSRVTLTRYEVGNKFIDTSVSEEGLIKGIKFTGREVIWLEATTSANNTVANARLLGTLVIG